MGCADHDERHALDCRHERLKLLFPGVDEEVGAHHAAEAVTHEDEVTGRVRVARDGARREPRREPVADELAKTGEGIGLDHIGLRELQVSEVKRDLRECAVRREDGRVRGRAGDMDQPHPVVGHLVDRHAGVMCEWDDVGVRRRPEPTRPTLRREGLAGEVSGGHEGSD